MKPALDLEHRLEVAIDACRQAGKITLAYFQNNVAVEDKADGSPVTIADRRAEAAIRETLAAHFPDDAILGEEDGLTKGGSGQWIIDPIDGTKSFICGVPLYAVLLAYEHEGQALIGVMNFPALGEMLWAACGLGCYWNGSRANVSGIKTLSDARLMCSDFGMLAEVAGIDALQELFKKTKLQRTWGDAYGYALVATGRAEIMIDPKMAVWDNGPLLPILEEAGGKFTSWDGVATIHGGNAIATNGYLHKQLREMLWTENQKK
jgi:histidinol phosphatase-like enzyme (inositol monophosphatase family)